MPQIRHEINILDHVLTALGSSGTATSNESVLLDTTQYNGTVTYYLEIVYDCSFATGSSVALRRKGTSTDDISFTPSDTPGVYKLARSSSFTPPAGQTEYVVFATGGTTGIPSGNMDVKSARIVIIQNATTLTNTETQIEIGNYNLTRTAESATILTNPKYWLYTAANWDGTKTFYAEAVYDSGDMDTITVGIYESTSITAPSWSLNATIVSAATTTTPTRTRVAFTPVDGRWYTIFSHNGSMDNHDIYRAGVIIQQADGAQLNVGGGNAPINSSDGSTSNNGLAQSFSIQTTSSITAVTVYVGKINSPTDNLRVDITSSLGGSSLGGGEIACSGLSASGADATITLDSPISLTGGVTYYLQFSRTTAADSTNRPTIYSATSTTYGTFGRALNSLGSWGSITTTTQLRFYLTGQSGLTKLEPQYLLANTLFAAGTSLQTSLTDWDSTEWSGVTNTYYFQAEAANGSTSDVTLNQADGGGAVTNSTLTNIDNAQISSAMTMPGDENLDVTATTNAGDIAAARILVATVVNTASAALTGTVTNDTEADIVTGGSTIILTLTGDTFIAAGTGPIGSTANTQALIDGITSAGAEGTGWNAVVRAGIETADVVRTSDTVATITLDAEATYNITANETITVTIPAAVLTGGVALVASPTFTITATVTDRIRDVISSGGGVIAFKR